MNIAWGTRSLYLKQKSPDAKLRSSHNNCANGLTSKHIEIFPEFFLNYVALITH